MHCNVHLLQFSVERFETITYLISDPIFTYFSRAKLLSVIIYHFKIGMDFFSLNNIERVIFKVRLCNSCSQLDECNVNDI